MTDQPEERCVHRYADGHACDTERESHERLERRSYSHAFVPAEPVKPLTCEVAVHFPDDHTVTGEPCGNPLPCKDHPQRRCLYGGTGRRCTNGATADGFCFKHQNSIVAAPTTKAEDERAEDHPPEFYVAAREAMQFKPLLAFEMGWNAALAYERRRAAAAPSGKELSDLRTVSAELLRLWDEKDGDSLRCPKCGRTYHEPDTCEEHRALHPVIALMERLREVLSRGAEEGK